MAQLRDPLVFCIADICSKPLMEEFEEGLEAEKAPELAQVCVFVWWVRSEEKIICRLLSSF